MRPPKHLSAWLSFAVLLSAIEWAQTAQAPQHIRGESAAADGLAHAFARAWNTHDAQAFRELYADDADWITVAGVRQKGMQAIVASLEKEHAGWARSTAIRVIDVTVREMQPEYSVVMFSWQITSGSGGDGRTVHGTTLMLAREVKGRWMIVAGQAAAALTSK